MNKREKAIQWLGTSAAMGLDKSQLELGHLFAKSGHYECALEWYLRSRNNNVPSASFYMANVMFKQERYEEAIKYYYESANLGDANAQLQLALACYNFWGLDSPGYLKHIPMHIRLDKRNARRWFYESAKGGNNEAAYYMGHLYENGQTVPVDKYHALAWYNESKARGYLPAIECIERLHKQGYIHVPKG
jgi:TPR repeat protein